MNVLYIHTYIGMSFTHMPQFTKQRESVLAKRRWCSDAGKVTQARQTVRQPIQLDLWLNLPEGLFAGLAEISTNPWSWEDYWRPFSITN